ncbi:hypothetical protein RchiOBHm_Chr7g0238051 [Rosa chinensis]|uniref:Uncharacterized protein n=1 Tax=Rosa chinensis TaxID=74649 RepID=A0A2P6PHD0_ROSCH|nr:hypothetical protein RchiOBHm_Chr7g0238051 [Rosa chinensis]
MQTEVPLAKSALVRVSSRRVSGSEKERAELEDLTENVFDLTLQDRSGEGESRN